MSSKNKYFIYHTDKTRVCRRRNLFEFGGKGIRKPGAESVFIFCRDHPQAAVRGAYWSFVTTKLR